MCQKWFAKFCAGDFLLDDAPQSGRPVEVDSNQIETLTKTISIIPRRRQRHTQNIQINKVTGENETFVFCVTEKTIWTFWSTQYLLLIFIFSIGITTVPALFIK